MRPASIELDVAEQHRDHLDGRRSGGTGLGSSATYLVALLTALHALKRERSASHALAEQACHIEMDLAGHAVGKHDHYMAAFGGITCLEIEAMAVSPLRLSTSPTPRLDELRHNVLLFFTGLTRSAGTILRSRSVTQRGAR